MEVNYLAHHGILGMKWGVRRYQNYDGTRIKRNGPPKSRYFDEKKIERARVNHDRLVKDRESYENVVGKNDPDFDPQSYLFTRAGESTMGKSHFTDQQRRDLKSMTDDYWRTKARIDDEWYNSNNKGVRAFFKSSKKKQEASELRSAQVMHLYSDFLDSAYSYIDKMPAKDRQAAAAYVYEMLGYNY